MDAPELHEHEAGVGIAVAGEVVGFAVFYGEVVVIGADDDEVGGIECFEVAAEAVFDEFGLAAVGAAGGDGDDELVVAGDGGGGEVAVGPVTVDTAAEDVLLAAGVEDGSVGSAAVGGGVDEGGVRGVFGFEFAGLVGDEVEVEEALEFGAEVGADDVDDGVGFEEKLGFMKGDFAATNDEAASLF